MLPSQKIKLLNEEQKTFITQNKIALKLVASEKLLGPGPTTMFWAKSEANATRYDGELEGSAIASWIASKIMNS